jgi:Fur family peroxide stress response transcriptional regulator
MKREKEPAENNPRSFESICSEHGLSITPQRVAIYKELVSSSAHPSAVTIFNKIRRYYSNISLDTVNRTLLTFHQLGLAKIVESSGDPKRFDPNLDPHHHFRCIACGDIFDFRNDAYDDLKPPPKIEKKFVITGQIVHLKGYCDRCKSHR